MTDHNIKFLIFNKFFHELKIKLSEARDIALCPAVSSLSADSKLGS